jgi:hypothetical protein
MTISHSTSIRTAPDDDELELPVEVVAERLGLPAAMLIRRIEAGDIPARRVEDAEDDEEDDDDGQEIRGTAEPLMRNGHVARTAEHVADDDAVALAEDDEDTDGLAGEDLADAVPPPPRGAVELAPLDAQDEGPRAELAMMALDPRELVAGLLDRWERTLEQRIYAEQRQRFEAELTNRQTKVKQLQLELAAVRAEHAAALAEKERQLGERYRELSEREREINDIRNQPRRRGWFARH